MMGPLLSIMRAECLEAASHSREVLKLQRRAGILDKMREIEAHAGCLMVFKAVRDGMGFWPDESGEWWFCVDVFDYDAETVIDLVAWPVADPADFRTAVGVAIGLGLTQVGNPATYAFGWPLYVYRTPLRWLEAGCDGCVVLDYPAAPDWLRDALGPICGEDTAHAHELARLLRGYVDRKQIAAPVGPVMRRAAA